MSQETIQILITAYFDSLETMDRPRWMELFAENAVIEDPFGRPPNKARENAEKFFGLLSMAFAFSQISRDCIFISGLGAAVKWTMRVQGKSGKHGMAEGITVFEFNEACKIQRVASFWDDMALMAQIRE